MNFSWKKENLIIPLGKDENGNLHLIDLNRTGNIITGGVTGSGKSIFNHNLICSLILKNDPSKLRFFFADPKRVELLGVYDKLPHVLGKVYTDCEDIISQLTLLKREIVTKKYPYLVIVIDTFSDLMAYDSDRFESVISDLSKLNHKGVYIIMCDSRTGPVEFSPKIMGCFPTKIAFNTCDEESSILLVGYSGAETFLNRGEMLLLQKGGNKPIRLQGSYISEEDIKKIVEHQG